ncbi:pre-mRNA-splicing factor CWF18, putative [Plasmodium ovale]|uniref:Pre-mRNA-splicing factor CWF18, putative n=1 Tax=Plasmodium ovale TaxID=36330 RepID=A0A1C3KW38_PLAOA|nr:pre-mRNA-splicing factor CWF18, putative [Plasmodium ovale]
MEIRDYDNLKFYNYVPVNKELKKSCVPCPNIEEYEAKLNEQLDKQLKSAFQGNILDQINAKNINVDLKRDVQKKLNILSKKTDKAIIELIKRKINESKNSGKNMSNDNYDENESTSMTLNFDRTNDIKFGHVLHQALNKLDVMDESD